MIQQIVTLTNQNQISIPIKMSHIWGEVKPKKLIISVDGNELRIKPVVDFRLLRGSLKSDIKLTDENLRQAKGEFEKKWARKM